MLPEWRDLPQYVMWLVVASIGALLDYNYAAFVIIVGSISQIDGNIIASNVLNYGIVQISFRSRAEGRDAGSRILRAEEVRDGGQEHWVV